MLKQWEKRVVIFQYIFSCLMKESFLTSSIPSEIKNDEDVYHVVEYALEHITFIQKIIVDNLKNNWTWERLSDVDKAILIAAYAEYQAHDIDKSIIIDQAIITAKNYSEENSYKFINYILDRILDAKV
ncbi:MAG: transcription antitermination protein NusB [Mycoplasmoidaceae bacterium]